MGSVGFERKTLTDKRTGVVTHEKRYFLLSFKSVKLFSLAARRHWHVETMHWYLDVIFGEDQNKTADKNSAINFNVIRKTAITLLKLGKCAFKKQNSIRSIMFRLSLNYEKNIEKILAVIDVKALQIAIECKKDSNTN